MPDLIIYAGDDITRFNRIPSGIIPREIREFFVGSFPESNYFEQIASFSKHGILVVAGNDDFPLQKLAITGEKVYDLHENPFQVNDYAFIGLEGATGNIGFLLYSEEQVAQHLENTLEKIPEKKTIIVSHAPPHGILDLAIRHGLGNIGSVSLKEFVDKHSIRIELVICGHCHFQGGKNSLHKGVSIINCASHDNEGSLGRVAIIECNGENVSVDWDDIYETEKSRQLSNLEKVPLIGSRRATSLFDAGICTITQLAQTDLNHELALTPRFRGSFELMINYAKAIIAGTPLITGIPSFFEDLESKNIYFFDCEYVPAKDVENAETCLIGWMAPDGKVRQLFLDNPRKERKIIEEFRNWLVKERPILVTFSSTSADKPQLIKNFKKFNLSTAELKTAFFDLFYDCLYTQKIKTQHIYLPIRGSLGLKPVSTFLGFEMPDLTIHDGLDALNKYFSYRKEKDKRKKEQLKQELLDYNKADLEETKFIFERLLKYFSEWKKESALKKE